ncbi:hypothetical protein LTR08_002967 [Meristemomyces frigidus]|nr:hypothetical protein LTR08_002967 [Meristemomyces frigidus]
MGHQGPQIEPPSAPGGICDPIPQLAIDIVRLIIILMLVAVVPSCMGVDLCDSVAKALGRVHDTHVAIVATTQNHNQHVARGGLPDQGLYDPTVFRGWSVYGEVVDAADMVETRLAPPTVVIRYQLHQQKREAAPAIDAPPSRIEKHHRNQPETRHQTPDTRPVRAKPAGL